MKKMFLLFCLMIGCGGIDVKDYITPTPDGDAAIPIKITQKNWTTCKKYYFETEDGYIFDDEGNAIWEVHCINLYDEQKYVIPAITWEDDISAHFIWVSIEQVKQWIADKEFILEKTSLYADNVPEALEVLEGFIYGDDE